MQAWTVVEAGEPLQEVAQPDPEPTGTEVVVEVSHCGVCHSDVLLWKGLFDMGDRKVPIEAVGITRPHEAWLNGARPKTGRQGR